MENMEEISRPRAVFMAFGTKGDVFPLAAIAAVFASDQKHYHVVFISHAEHQSLKLHLKDKNVVYIAVSTPPILSTHQFYAASDDSNFISFGMHKMKIKTEHKEECLSAVAKVFGDSPCIKGDFIAINFFALEGWNIAELYQIQCVVAAPYVVPYSAPFSFERCFKKELPLLYKYFCKASDNEVCWNDVVHWMWPLFTEEWGKWRSECLCLGSLPFTDPVTNLPMWHMRERSPLLLYGFSKEIVECPGYWPTNAHACGFWFLPLEWQFCCIGCREKMSSTSSECSIKKNVLCTNHAIFQNFLMDKSSSHLPIFIGLSSIGRHALNPLLSKTLFANDIRDRFSFYELYP
nr:putative glycosyltransferase [Anoectochilus roxburghii]